jgi:hypothetical protein
VYGFDGDEEKNPDGFSAATIFFFNGAASTSPTMDVIGGVNASVGHKLQPDQLQWDERLKLFRG